jgi:tetratricopeptide (TPR) repeat protein
MAVERGARLAEDACLEAVAANETSSTAWAALGLVQSRLHEREQAEKSINRALELDPTDPYAQSVMIGFLHDHNQDSKALPLLELLEETPGTLDLVEKIRREILSRRMAQLLVERGLDRLQPGNPRRIVDWAWLAVVVALVVGICAVVRPTSLVGVFICVVMPLTIYWLARQLAD